MADITADTIRHARKYLANNGWRRDGHYFDADVLDDDAEPSGPACVVGAVGIASGTFTHADDAVHEAFARWFKGFKGHTTMSVTWWNDHEASEADVHAFLEAWEAELEAWEAELEAGEA